MLDFVAREVKNVTVDPKSGDVRFVLMPERAGMALAVSLPRAQAEELCDSLYDGFCALLARDDKRHDAWIDTFYQEGFYMP